MASLLYFSISLLSIVFLTMLPIYNTSTTSIILNNKSNIIKIFLSNIFFLLTILYFIDFSRYSYVLTLVSFIIIGFFQTNSASILLHENLLSIPSHQINRSAHTLIKENCIITICNIHIYALAILKANLLNIKELFSDFFQDITGQSLLKKPLSALALYRAEFDRLYFLIFKKKNLRKLVKTRPQHSGSKLFVKRLPLQLKNVTKSTATFRLIFSNLAIIYNFTKTTVIALTLCLMYFIYTIFFFKIQFLKQLSVWFVTGMLFF